MKGFDRPPVLPPQGEPLDTLLQKMKEHIDRVEARLERYARRVQQLEHNERTVMATKEQLAAAVGDLKTNDAAQKVYIAALTAERDQLKTDNATLTAANKDLTDKVTAADQVDDGVVADIQSVAADIKPPAAQ